MQLINPNTVLALNEQQIDHDHLAFVDLVNQLEEADDSSFPALFEALVQHIESHFAYENQLMDTSKFPAIGEHQGEHHRVLGQLSQFLSRVQGGRLNFARAFVKEQLPAWFSLHVSTMDAALVAHVARQQSLVQVDTDIETSSNITS